VLLVLTFFGLSAAGQVIPKWKVFTSRGGWSISHPSNWRIGSCHACKDPKKPGVFVDFFSPDLNEGWVIVEPLAEKPSNTSPDSWLSEVAKTANVNPHIDEQELKVNDLPALKVCYRTSSDQQIESVYVLSGLKTFEIEFSGDLSRQGTVKPLETLGNYQTYLKMLQTFRVLDR
jgi:hypothetical protein